MTVSPSRFVRPLGEKPLAAGVFPGARIPRAALSLTNSIVCQIAVLDLESQVQSDNLLSAAAETLRAVQRSSSIVSNPTQVSMSNATV